MPYGKNESKETVTMIGDKGKINVNIEDVQNWMIEGYVIFIENNNGKKNNNPKVEKITPENNELEEDYSKWHINDLKNLARTLNIKGYYKLKKTELVKALKDNFNGFNS